MSLPAGQQRILQQIEGALKNSDPRLAALLAIFGRLTHGEAMPCVENLKVRPVADRVARLLAFARRLPSRPARRVRVLLLLPAALTALICGLAIAVGLPGSGRSTPAKSPAARELVIKSRGCKLPVLRFPVYAPC